MNKSYLCTKRPGDGVGVGSPERIDTQSTVKARSPAVCLELTSEKLAEYLGAHADCKELVLPLMSDAPDFLRKLSFFKDIPDIRLKLLGSLLRYVALRRNQVLFEEGSLGTSLYIVIHGQVDTLSIDPTGHERLLHLFTDGDVFGEIALIMDIPRTATIRAKSDHVLLFELERDSFQKFLKLMPNQNLHLNDILKTRVAEHFRKYKVTHSPLFSSGSH